MLAEFRPVNILIHIPMDTTVRLGPLKFSLRATIDRHGPSIHSGHYTASINCCKNILLQRSHNYGFGIADNENSSIAYIMLYELIDTWILDSNRRVGVWSLPWRWHILSIPLTTGRGTSTETCGLDDVFPPDDPSRSSVLIYMYICIPYMSSVCYRTYIYIYIYIYIYNGSFIQYWRSCTPFIGFYFWGVRGSWVECHFLFSLVYQLCLALW